MNVEKNQYPEYIEIPDKLNEYIKLINCQYIDIIKRRINDVEFQVVLDDEGLLRENPKISAFGPCEEIAGNLVITGLADENGNLTDLNEDTAMKILDRTSRVLQLGHPIHYIIEWD